MGIHDGKKPEVTSAAVGRSLIFALAGALVLFVPLSCLVMAVAPDTFWSGAFAVPALLLTVAIFFALWWAIHRSLRNRSPDSGGGRDKAERSEAHEAPNQVCQQCGHRRDAGDMFCRKCGHGLR